MGENARRIMENGLRVPGEVTSDGALVEVRHRESYGRGIYAATDMNFGRSFGGKTPCVFLCLAVAGQVQEVSSRSTSISWEDEHSAGSVRRGALRMYRRSDQVLPLFVTDARKDTWLRDRALRIMEFLMSKVLGVGTSGTQAQQIRSVHSLQPRIFHQGLPTQNGVQLQPVQQYALHSLHGSCLIIDRPQICVFVK